MRSGTVLLVASISACGSENDGASARAETRLGAVPAAVVSPSVTRSFHAREKSILTPTRDSHITIVDEMKRVLIAAGTMDGAAITDIRTRSHCRTIFVTANGATEIDWSKVGNIAPRLAKGREINDLANDEGNHELSIETSASSPARDNADGISGAVGLLAGDCGAVQ